MVGHAAACLEPGLRAEEQSQDWGRVHALRHGERVGVKLFEGMDRKVVGDYESSNDSGIMVWVRGGNAVEINRDRVREVVWKRRLRLAPTKGTVIGFGVGAIATLVMPGVAEPAGMFVIGGFGASGGSVVGLLVRIFDGPRRVYRASKGGPSADPTRSAGKQAR